MSDSELRSLERIYSNWTSLMQNSECRMRKIVAIAFCILHSAFCILGGCSKEQPAGTETTDTREPIAIYYVGAPEMEVRAKPAETAAVVTKFLNGESVPVLARKGDWAEVRIVGGSGWVHMADLTTAEVAKKEQQNPTPRFRVPPSPVTATSAHGTVYIEANVNTEGEITSTKIITNTTGSEDLALKNAAALQRARFYPIVQKGQRKAFIYYYRVDY